MSGTDGDALALSACGGQLCAHSEIALGWPGEETGWTDLSFQPGDTIDSDTPGLGAGRLEVSRACRDGIEVIREILHPRTQPDAIACRLRLVNGTDADLHLSRLSPLAIGPDGLRLGNDPAGDWVYLRGPRKKNDMPACVRLGGGGPGIWDAVHGTPETGGLPQGAGGDLPRQYISSELTGLACGDTALALGFLPLDRQLVQSVLTLDAGRTRLESLRLDCVCDGQVVPPGAEVESQWVLARFAPDLHEAIEAYTDCLLQAHPRRAPRGERPPTVWCSWYYYGDGFTQKECEENLAALEQRPLPVDVFQIDECWDRRWADWRPNADWPDLKGVADRARKLGMEPGIWTCPVLTEPRSRLRYGRTEWLLRDRQGGLVTFPMNGMGNPVLDPTVPEVADFIEGIYRWLREEMGYTYFKLDFMRAVGEPGGVFADPTRNRAQAFRLALEAVRRGAGEDAYINVCGGFYGPSLGLADAQRSGSDVKSIWPDAPAGEEEEGYGPFTIKQNALRYWMNRLWDNDPDALMVRRRPTPARDERLSLGLLNEDEALTCALNQYLGGGLVCFTENLAEIDDDRLFLLRHCAPAVGAAALPRDLLRSPRFPAVFDTAVAPTASGLDPWHTVSVVNWHHEPRTFQLVLDRKLLGPLAPSAETYLVSAFSAGWHRAASAGETIEVGPIPPHGCEVVKVQRHLPDQPQLVRTDGHFSMGGTEVSAWSPTDEGVDLQVEWPWPVPLRLWLCPPAGRAFTGCGRDELAELLIEGRSEGVEHVVRYE